MDWVRVESSVLAAAAYAPYEQVLHLEFRSGAIYRYFDVPQELYEGFSPPIPKADSSAVTFGIASRSNKSVTPIGLLSDPISWTNTPGANHALDELARTG